MQDDYDPHMIEEKWREIWKKNKTFQAEPDPSKPKFMITIPFPYLNGNLHAGHTRTFTIGDVIARYKRMQGYNVLFPMAFHVTGTPIVGLADLVKKRDPQTMRVYQEFHGIPKEKLETLEEPEKIVDFFKTEAEHDMSVIGYSIDWRRKFTTTAPAFRKFVEWQYKTLEEKGLIIKGSHPVKWCPFDNNPVEDHDILKGEEATIVDYTLIKFRYKDTIFPCATLRPETTYGVTNLWMNPAVEYVRLDVKKGELQECWVVSRECYEKLKYTDHEVTFIETVRPKEIIGIRLKNPVTDSTVVTLPAAFVRGNNGSGVVMSVPAHAPFDCLALRDLTKPDAEKELFVYGLTPDDVKKIKPISVIDVPEYGAFPAEEIVGQMGIDSQEDPKAEEATKIIYRREFHGGRLKENTGKYHGIAVSKIKDRLTQDLIAQGVAEVFYEFSEPVTCRCGTPCVVNMVKGQWFLNYSKPEWKDDVRKCLAGMEIIPGEMRADFENKIDWLKDKACARRKGLGTKLPCDPQWLIESLGDSTVYMAYYTIAKYADNGDISEENMTVDFFNYIFLEKGDRADVSGKTGVSAEKLEEIRGEFEYWYPVDLRSSGKDLVPNHLLFFLFHHVALFDESKWPKAIAVNGFVSLEGQKMSKSKGPLLTLKKAVSEYGADVARMYVLSAAEQTQDADWQRIGIESASKQIERFYLFAGEIIKSGCMVPDSSGGLTHIDRWIESRIQNYIRETNEGLETIHTRHAIQNAFFLIYNDIKWYHKRGGKRCLKEVVETWTKLMAPFTPHICEEIWHELGHETSVAFEPYPAFDPALVDGQAEVAEEIIKKTMEDIDEIRRVTKVTPGKVYLYTSPEWKLKVLKKAVSMAKEQEGRFPEAIDIAIAAIADDDIRHAGRESMKRYASPALREKIEKMPEILAGANDIIAKNLDMLAELRSKEKETELEIRKKMDRLAEYLKSLEEKGREASPELAEKLDKISKAVADLKERAGRKLSERKEGADVGQLIRDAMTDPEIKARGKEAQKYIQKAAMDVRGSSVSAVERYLNAAVDEKAVLLDAKAFLEQEYGCTFEIYSSADIETNPDGDPQKKSRLAEPARPAIYMTA